MEQTEKRYSDKELAKVIEKALVLQQQETMKSQDGMTESELIALAGELGIKEKYLMRAMEDPDLPQKTKSSLFLGGPTKQDVVFYLDRSPEKFDLTEAAAQLSDVMKMRGSGSAIEGQLSWQNDSMTSYQSGISSQLMGYETRDGKYKVEIRENYGMFAGAIYGGIGGGLGLGVGLGLGLGVGLGSLGSVLFSVLFPLGVLFGSYFLCRGIFKSYTKYRKNTILEAMDKLKRRLAEKKVTLSR
ncbi:MAG: hypothetical protein JXR70_00895 [Spirochaetales bacterium]|nr:hypothetical protein [Spirochaetales bacterium]